MGNNASGNMSRIQSGQRPDQWTPGHEAAINNWQGFTPAQQTQFMQDLGGWYRGQPGRLEQDRNAVNQEWNSFTWPYDNNPGGGTAPPPQTPPAPETPGGAAPTPYQWQYTTGQPAPQPTHGSYIGQAPAWQPGDGPMTNQQWQQMQMDAMTQGKPLSQLQAEVGIENLPQGAAWQDPNRIIRAPQPEAPQQPDPLGPITHPFENTQGTQVPGSTEGGQSNNVYEVLNSLYRQMLNRDVDPSGYGHYGSYLREGGPGRGRIISDIYGSPEYRQQDEDYDWLNSYYNDVFGRDIGHEGWNFYNTQYDAGFKNQDEIFQDLFHSPEGQNRFLHSLAGALRA